jgi:hypothetical protein
MSHFKPMVSAGFLFFLAAGTAKAQVDRGVISGTVKDSSGAAIVGAKVEVVNEDTRLSRVVETGAEGRYSAVSLSLGKYQLTATHDGFQKEIHSGVEVTVGSEVIVDMTLQVGSTEQTVVVTGAVPLVDSTSGSLHSLVDDQTIRSLPLNGRSWTQLATLTPGVTVASPGITGGSPFTFGTGQRFSVQGQRPESNAFLLDGTNIDDQGNGTPGGAAGNNLGVDTILEFKVFTSAFKAEYGRVSGSITSASTRSGTDTFHGTAYEYIRNNVLDASNFFDVNHSPPPFRRNQFGGVLGGSIRKDKTFFFAGYEGLRQGLATTLTAIVPSTAARIGILPTGKVTVNPAIVPYLQLYPLPNGANFGDGTAAFISAPTAVTNEDYFMARLDHQLTSSTGIFVRYAYDDDSINAPGSITNFFALSTSRRQYLTAQANTVLSSKSLNHFLFAFNRTSSTSVSRFVPDPGPALALVPGQPFGTIQVGAANFQGSRALTQLGPSVGSGPTIFPFNVFEWSDDFTHVAGKHSFKIGGDIQYFRDDQSVQTALWGALTFTNLTTLLEGKPSNMQASSPLGVPPSWRLRQMLYALYAQDDYSVNSRLTLNFGLRWEMATNPNDLDGKQAILPSPSATQTVASNQFFNVGKANFGPRFGLAWILNGSGTTVLRAGGGIYYDQILPWAYGQYTAVPPFFGTASASNPPFPNSYLALKQALTNLKTTAPSMKAPTAYQYTVSLQQQVSKGTVVQLAYVGNVADHLPLQTEADPAKSVTCSSSLGNCPAGLADGTIFYPVGSPRVNPAWAGIRLLESSARSNYNAVTATVRVRFSNRLDGQIFYAFSKNLDDSSAFNNGESTQSPTATLYPGNPAPDYGLSNWYAKHYASGYLTYSVPFRTDRKALGVVVNDWTLDAIGTLRSGEPFTATLAASVSRNLASVQAERPNLKPGFSNNPTSGVSAGCTGMPVGTPVGTATHWYDPCAFSLPLAGTYGDLGRNTLISAGLGELDLALEKRFVVREPVNLTFRAEAFNILNHTNLGIPNTIPLTTSGTASGTAGLITYTTTSSRQLQFGLRLNF